MPAANTGNFSDHRLSVALGAFAMGYLQEQMRDIATQIVVAERVGEVDSLSGPGFVVKEIDALEIIEIMFVRVERVGQGVSAFHPVVDCVGNPDELRDVEEETDEEDNVLSRSGVLLIEDTQALEHFRREEPCPVGAQEWVDSEALGRVAWRADLGKPFRPCLVGEDCSVGVDFVMTGPDDGVVFFECRIADFKGCWREQVVWVGKAEGFSCGRPNAGISGRTCSKVSGVLDQFYARIG